MTIRLTSTTIRALLRKHLPEREWALAYEVSDGTGANARRHADAVAMNLWPSRGLALHGYEIKVSRSDWQSELKKPAKADAVARFCDYWWLVTGPGIVRVGELPETWGLMEVRDDALVAVTLATKREAVPVDRGFMASLFRRLSTLDSEDVELAVETRIAAIEADHRAAMKRQEQGFDARVARHVADEMYKFEATQKLVENLEASTGLSLAEIGHRGKDFGKAVQLVLDSKVFGTYGSIEHLRNSLAGLLSGIDGALGAYRDAPVPASPGVVERVR